MSEKKTDSENQTSEMDFLIDFAQVEEVSRVFFEESKEILNELEGLILQLEENPSDMDRVNLLFRKVHTIKGSVGAVPGGQLLGSLAHEFEALLNRIKKENRAVTKDCIDLFLKSTRILKVLAYSLRDKRELFPEELSEAIELIASYGTFSFPQDSEGNEARALPTPSTQTSLSQDEGVWLSSQQMDEFLRLSGELLVLKNFFQMMNQTVNFRVQPDLFQRRQTDFSQSLAKLCDQFQNQVQVVRKEPALDSFRGLNVVVRQASTELNKTIHFEIAGGDLQIDKALGKDLYEALVHVARNSVDHGIEDQFERAVQGKSSIGNLFLEISEKNNTLFLNFKDDGKGLDKEKILQKALKVGLVTEEMIPTMSDQEIYRCIFNPGFSTKDKVTTISGRGVGMDVVWATVQKYQGEIHIKTQEGQGTEFLLEIPIPQHIMVETALLCTWREHQFAVPLVSVAHIDSCQEFQITKVDRMRYCQFHGLTVPLMNYQEMLGIEATESEEIVRSSSAVIIKVQDRLLALLVDKIETQTDLVVKAFSPLIGEQRGFKGISILADEKVTYIIDPEKLMLILLGAEVRQEAA